MKIELKLSATRYKTPERPVYIYVIFDRLNRRKIKTDIRILPEQWSSETESVINHPQSGFLNKQLRDHIDTIRNQIDQAHTPGLPFTIADFDAVFRPERQSTPTAPDMLVYMLKVLSSSKQLKEGTIKDYYKTYTRLKRYYGVLPFDKINYQLLLDFDRRCMEDGHVQNTISKHHKTIKMILHKADREEVWVYDPREYPYKKFRVPRIRGHRESLTQEELKRIEQVELPAHLDAARRMFLFLCCTGLRISDFCKLDFASMVDVEGVLRVKPQKTETSSAAQVNLPLKVLFAGKPYKIWETFGFEFPNQDARFPEQFNYNLKQVAIAAGVHKHLSAHVGRHTFLSQIANKTGNVFTVMLLGGLKKVETAQVYIHLSAHEHALDNVNWG